MRKGLFVIGIVGVVKCFECDVALARIGKKEISSRFASSRLVQFCDIVGLWLRRRMSLRFRSGCSLSFVNFFLLLSVLVLIMRE